MDSPAHDEEKFERWLGKVRKDESGLFFGMGDYLDSISASERRHMNHRDSVHDSTYDNLNDFYKAKTDEFFEKIKFMKGRVIGLLEGNHYWTFDSGITTTQYLCQLLECKYLGVMTTTRVVFRKMGGYSHKVDICAHHGNGGNTVGSSFKSIEDLLKVEISDIYMMGDNHSIGVSPGEIRDPGWNVFNPKNKTYLLCRTGGFLKGYLKEKSTYIADRGKPSKPSGAVEINLDFVAENKGQRKMYLNGGTML